MLSAPRHRCRAASSPLQGVCSIGPRGLGGGEGVAAFDLLDAKFAEGEMTLYSMRQLALPTKDLGVGARSRENHRRAWSLSLVHSDLAAKAQRCGTMQHLLAFALRY